MGDIDVGDFITDPTNGGTTKVIAVHPHEAMPIWRFTFDDGASLEVGDDHLWAYRLSNHQRPRTKASSERTFAREELNACPMDSKWSTNRVGRTSEVRSLFEAGEKVRIPLTEPVIFTCRGKEHSLDPYLVGLYLGDGNLSQVRLTTADEEIAGYLRKLGFREDKKSHQNAAMDFRANGDLRKQHLTFFRNNDLVHAHSWEKFVPHYLKYGMLNERLGVLRGLLDTDGSVDKRGRVSFCSTSLKLAEDVQFIVRSLGGKARIHQRQTFYPYAGEKRAGRPAYFVRIWHHKTTALFGLSRKRERCTDSWNGGHEISRELTSIEYVGEKDARCITVASPYGLYVANDFVVTHNSEALKAWMAMGDPLLPEGDPAKYSYLNEPSFRGLFLRHQYQDLEEFIDECEDFFRPFGGKATGKPRVIEFKSKARIYFRHLGDADAYNQARGWGLTKIGVEELTQIPEERWYLKLLGSLRNKKQFRVHGGKQYGALRTQIMSSTNPDGPGTLWCKNRFVKVYAGGKLAEPNRPLLDPISGLRRIFIPMKREDNPYLRDNKQYEGMLLLQDAVTRRQWMEGDWDAGSGTFFTEYRPDGPIGDDEKLATPWARHKIDPVPLKPWWFRWGSTDLGYQHPSTQHKFVRNDDDKRVHIYDELSVRQVAAYELGILTAKWWIPELEALPDHQVTIYLSPDAFAKRDVARSLAEQMANGIQEVLGPYGALLMRFTDDERLMAQRDPERAQALMQNRQREAQGKMCIILKPANNDVEAGCSYIRELLRFRPALTETQDQLKTRLSHTFASSGIEAYERELLKAQSKGKTEVLPRLQIWKICRGLDRCLKTAIHDEPPRNERYKKFDAVDGKGGDDEIDDTRYWVADRMAEFQRDTEMAFGTPIQDINRLIQMQQAQASIYDKSHHKSTSTFTFPRAASQRHRTQ
jgi:hypothetical protein